jgi:CHAD domain-containing protein
MKHPTVETPPPTSRVRLRSAEGTWRGTLPRTAPRDSVAADVRTWGREVRRGIRSRWRKLRRLLRRGLPGRRGKRLDEGIHDLRRTARRFHSILWSLPRTASGKPGRQAMKTADRVLDATGSLRDLTVQKALLTRIFRRPPKVMSGFVHELDREYARGLKKLPRRLQKVSLRKTHRAVRALVDRVGRKAAVAALARSFEEVQDSRLHADPTDGRSLHRLRIALKRFRYVTQLFEERVPVFAERATASVRSLQRTMGDLRDLEALSAALAAHAESVPGSLSELATALEKLEARHSAMLKSFLKSVDAIVRHWGRRIQEVRASA